MKEQGFAYGLIEGFYGKPWSWENRHHYADFLKQQGYGFYIYAPKSDLKLREHWQQAWTEQEKAKLVALADEYHKNGLKFGIALSPYQLYTHWNADTRDKLRSKIQEINDIKPDILCVLFDDMRGDLPELAGTQAEICDFIGEQSTAEQLIMCPTYYSDDPILDKIFGQRPADYLAELGQQLDKKYDVFWTGPQVWSVAYPPDHLLGVTELLGRKPTIWDNYPVNDMKNWPYLFLKPFENRLWQMKELTAGHMVNPMNQAFLSKIPLSTLPAMYQQEKKYHPDQVLAQVLSQLCEADLASAIAADLNDFQFNGIKSFSPERMKQLQNKYRKFNSPFAEEIRDWLAGEYEHTSANLEQWQQG